MTPGIGPLNARRKILAGLKRRLAHLDAALDAINDDGSESWAIKKAAESLLDDTAKDRSDAYTTLLKSFVEGDIYADSSDLWKKRRMIRDLLELFGERPE